MSQKVGVRSLVAVGAGVVVIVGVLVSVLTGGDSPKPADPQQMAMGAVCTQAAQVQLRPLITLPSGEYTSTQDGAEWLVRTSVDHKTQWVDNWYDVTCVVVLPEMRVASVRSEPRR